MTTDRRPLWRPFSSEPADLPVQAPADARLLAAERSPFLEPVAPADRGHRGHRVAGGRRPLGPGGLVAGA
ncbi:hypothetical protein [Kitasatospora sp. NPDC087315]|uniref:hypothetical protein n=1 Tax=Kitasatospora sp. NPDC087315 TaxID=3364069 RepID=UPI0037F213AE